MADICVFSCPGSLSDAHVRFTYAQDLDRLSTALDRIERALKDAAHNRI